MSSDFRRLRLLVLLLASTAVLAAFGCSDDDSVVAPKPLPFSGAYAMENWTESGIQGGTTAIEPDSGSTASAVFSYDVQLGGGGVSFRMATFAVPVPKSGVVSFDWVYTGFHAWCCPATAYFRVFADGDEFVAVDSQAGGGFTFSGTAAINVSDTGTFGFEIGGQNFDSDSRLQGTLTITKFRTP